MDPAADKPPASPTIEHVLAEIQHRAFEGEAICTGWVIVSEWLGADGEYWTHVEHDDRNPPWRHTGLLSYTLDEGLTLDADEDEDEFEDDD